MSKLKLRPITSRNFTLNLIGSVCRVSEITPLLLSTMYIVSKGEQKCRTKEEFLVYWKKINMTLPI